MPASGISQIEYHRNQRTEVPIHVRVCSSGHPPRFQRLVVGAAVDATGGAGFGDDEFGEFGEVGFEVGPDPECEVFAGGVFESGHFIEVVVVELFPEWFEGFGDIGVVHDPAVLGVAFSADHDFDLEAVSVEASAFVLLRNIGQVVCGLKLEGFAQVEFHEYRDFVFGVIIPNRSR